MTQTAMPNPAFARHDHQTCIAGGVARAEAQCRAAGLQLTPVRRRVLELLLAEHRALGAYEILDILRAEGLGSQPPVAYRALDFLQAHGFAHKIEKLNAFIACARPGEAHDPAFLICRVCSGVAEAPTEPSKTAIGQTARDAGFVIEKTVLEAEGICPNCRPKAAAS